MYKELITAAKVENLAAVNDFVEGLLADTDCSSKTQMQIELVVEEIFVNIASYAYGGGEGEAILRGRILEAPLGLELIFMDKGAPYDPLARTDPDVNAAMEDRGIGGLGIFLVKKNVDAIKYAYQDGQNILSICKYF
ncbi:Anti-sigma regulatory factor (Ser/Thr protein kinase) [Selenomonas ruminantium]|uniref:Anti-sigma regulatory factor (Ser/Thr protein kinase) n=1 Tax=Selenomonas ruminantium TaxID=971 RepID=A0A1M6S8N0_SELRU|nr:ATP-binding protein [Selenomonas ruminantium]SHK41065.1 Anti-sigma regulatory factor (Ser/Thr protein kinase) [Selenomonas ruminantium]